jgi:SAM-dependent methyltransferase
MLKKITKYYLNINVNKKNYYKLVDWPSKERQLEEFNILTTFFSFNNSYTINDFGCGTGDLVRFLKKKPNLYYGYDINKEFIKICKKRFREKKYFFFTSKKIIKKADYTIASGAFSIKGNLNNRDFSKIVFNSLSNIIDFTNKKIALNFHWDFCPTKKRRSYMFYSNMNQIKKFLKKKGVKKFYFKSNKRKFVFYLFVSL